MEYEDYTQPCDECGVIENKADLQPLWDGRFTLWLCFECETAINNELAESEDS